VSLPGSTNRSGTPGQRPWGVLTTKSSLVSGIVQGQRTDHDRNCEHGHIPKNFNLMSLRTLIGWLRANVKQ